LDQENPDPGAFFEARMVVKNAGNCSAKFSAEPISKKRREINWMS
jgi:hypothetical protein